MRGQWRGQGGKWDEEEANRQDEEEVQDLRKKKRVVLITRLLDSQNASYQSDPHSPQY